MRRAAALAVLLALAASCAAASNAGLPGARAIKVCAAAGPYWPTMTLALQGTSAWIACKEQSRVIRVNTKTGKRTKSVRLRGAAIAVKAGFGSIWALDSGGTLYRLSPSGKVIKRISLQIAAAYNIWVGGGSVWVAADQGAQVVRVSPETSNVVARIEAGDGPASMAFDGGSTAWVINHRDTTIDRIDLATNQSTLATTLGGDRAPERMVWLNGSLWITGRGTDLLELNPATGSIEQTIPLDFSGIDLIAAGDDLWIPTRSAEVDPTGFPTMNALKRVSASTGAVSTAAQATGRVDVNGLAAGGGAVWIADNRSGYLYRVPAG